VVLSGLYLTDHGITLFEVQLSPCCLPRKDQHTWASVIQVGSATVRHDLHRSSCSNGMVPNAAKHECRDQWARSGAFVAKKVWRDIVGWTCALTTPDRPNLHRSLCSNGMVRNAPKHEFGVPWRGSGAFCCKIFERDNVAWTCALMAPVQPILRQSLCTNEMVRNAPKHEFGGQ
jgi:hypothetical protein